MMNYTTLLKENTLNMTYAFTSYFLFTGFSDIFIIISHGKYLDMIMLKIYDMKDNMKGLCAISEKLL